MRYYNKTLRLTAIVLRSVLTLCLIFGAQAAFADGSGNADTAIDGCMQDVAGFGINCTANDIQIAGVADRNGDGKPDITIVDDGCAFPGDTVTFTATFEVLLTAQARHDVGLWFATDGDPNTDGALTGICTVGTPAYAPNPPWLDLDGTTDTFLNTNVVSNIQDTCGDIDATHNPLYPVMTVTAKCIAGPNGNLSLPNCTSWKQPGDNDLCTGPLPVPNIGGPGLGSSGVPPGSPSKCRCDKGFTVPIRVPAFITADKVTVDNKGVPISDETGFNFSITGPTVGPTNPKLPDNFILTDATTPHLSPSLDTTDQNGNVVGPYQVTETVPPLWELSASCTRDNATPNNSGDDTTFAYTNGGNIQPLPGEVIACTFTNKKLIDPPVLSVVKENDADKDGIFHDTEIIPLGAAFPYMVTYQVTITNSSSSDATISSIGDVPHSITGSSCAALLNTTIAAGETKTCTFDHTFTTADPFVPTGSVINTFTVTATNDAGSDTKSDTSTVSVDESARLGKLSLVKSATPPTYDAVDQTITYSYTITNSGKITLDGPFSVADDKALDESCTQPADNALSPNETMNCTATYKITQADIDAGSVTNKATATNGTVTSNEAQATVNAVLTPALSLVKTATPSTYAAVGDVISYSYLVQNTGNVTFAGPVTVADDKATASCPAGGLAPGAQMTCAASYTITQADIDNGSVTNTATASANGTTSPPDDETVNAVKNPHLSIVKTATESSYSAVGQVLHYTIVATNDGNTTLAAVTVTDPNVTGLTCTPANGSSLAPGASMTCTATHTVTQADIDAGNFANIACVDDGANGAAQVCASKDVPALQNPALSLVKTATPSTYAEVGDVISYSYLVKNTGNVTFTGPVTVADDKATVSCPAGGLAPGAQMTCAASYTITQADIDNGSVTNTATASANGTTSPPDDETVNAVKNPHLSIAKTATESSYSAVGQVLHYTIVATNDGNTTLAAVTVTDPNVTGLTCTPANGSSLAPGASMTCTATHTVTQADIDAGHYANSACVDDGPNGADQKCAGKDVPGEMLPALSLVKTAAPSTYDTLNQTITYSYVITNSGNVTLNGPFSVTDNKATVTCTQPADGALSPKELMNCTATYKISQADLDNGSVTNTATASNGTVTSNQAQATVTAIQKMSLNLVKSADPLIYDHAGQSITYTYTITNTSNVTLAGPFAVTDDKAMVTCTQPSDGALSPNETMSCTATYVITQTDMYVNSVTNRATATNGMVTSNEATATVYKETGALLPTQTTCQQYAAGPDAWPAMYDAFLYQVKGSAINSVSPGVIFYYNTITAPAASFYLDVTETNTLKWKDMLVQDLGQAILYSDDCSKAPNVTVTTSTTAPYTVKFTVTGATEGATYYIGIKYTPQNLIGQKVAKPYPTDTYSFSTSINGTPQMGSGDSIPVAPK